LGLGLPGNSHKAIRLNTAMVVQHLWLSVVLLDGATAGNNAFVMKIGQLLIVEFGETGNAAYMFNAKTPPFKFMGALHLRSDLKNGRNLGTLKHQDGQEKWEQKFRRVINEHAGIMGRDLNRMDSEGDRLRTESVHAAGGVFTPNNFQQLFRSFCAERGLRFVDNRGKGGNLIVYADAANPRISGTLGQWGFKFDSHSSVWTKSL
jgi:hypothetical protein